MKTDTEEKEYLNSLIPIKEYESVIKNLAIKKIQSYLTFTTGQF